MRKVFIVVVAALALVGLSSWIVIGQSDEIVGLLQPFVIDVQQEVPVIVSVPIDIDGKETITATIPLTVAVDLRVRVDTFTSITVRQ